MSLPQIERHNNVDTAKKAWHQVIEQQKLRHVIKDYTFNGFTSRLYYLQLERQIARGAGKGKDSADIDISASYEALEFFLTGYSFRPYPVIQGNLLEISNKYSPLLIRCDADQFKIAAQYTQLPWVIYEDLKTNAQHAAPLAAVDLSYLNCLFAEDTINYQDCLFYAASNGVASGSCYEEAVIHGALEILERDAYSYLLIDTFILKKPLRLINLQSLPSDLISVIERIEKNFNNPVKIIQMPSRFGVHAYLATFLNKEFVIQPRGAGASLNARYAVERAIYELIQTYHLMHGEYVESDIHKDKLNNNSLMKDIMEFDCREIIDNTSSITVDFIDNASDTETLSLNQYLIHLLNLINSQSSTLLVNTVYTHTNGITCLRIHISETEEFFLATHYLKLTPQEKTADYITKVLGKPFSWNHFET
jgi:YcaO-like protein with predicted kinase domain